MPNRNPSLNHNIRLLYIINFFDSSMFILPIYILFGTQYLGLNYLQASSFFIVNLLVSVALDFLGGVVADKIGRKETFIYGMALQVASYIPFLITKDYWILLIFAAINGLGLALCSNSIDALIFEEAIEVGEKKIYQHANSNVGMLQFVGRIFASIVGGIAYNIDPRLPYALFVGALGVALVAGVNLRVDKRADMAKQPKYLESMKLAFAVYKSNLAMFKFVAIAGMFMFFADMLYTFYQPFFIEKNVSSSVLGILTASISACSAVGSYYMRKLPDKYSAQTIQTISIIGAISTAVCLMVLNMPIVLAAPLIMGMISGFMFPNMRLFINHRTHNKVRASVLSLATTFISIGTALGLWATMYFVDYVSNNTILIFIIAGSVITLLANIFIKVPDTRV